MKNKTTLFKTLILFVLFVITSVYLFKTLYPLSHLDIIQKYSEKYSLPPSLVCAVIYTESKFKNKAMSHKGASGLMQITEQTANWLGEKLQIENYSYDNIYDPEININIGTYNLRRLLDYYDDNLDLTLASYNAGEGNVAKWLKDKKFSKDGLTLDNIPFKETENYIKKVKKYEKIYRIILKFYGGTNDK